MKASSPEIFRAFAEELSSGKVEPAYTFCGEEAYLVERATRLVVETLVPEDERDWNYEKISAVETDAQDVISAAMTYPMFGEKRVLVVTEMDSSSTAALRAWEAYLRKPTASTVVVFPLPGWTPRLRPRARKDGQAEEAEQGGSRPRLDRILQQHTRIVEFPPVREAEAVAWVLEEVQSHGKRITSEAAQLLVAEVGPNLLALENEIEKLVLSCQGKDEIALSDVEDVVVGQRGYTVYHLLDAIGEQELKSAWRILRRLLEQGTRETAILSSVFQHFAALALVAAGVSKGMNNQAIAQELGIGDRDWLVRKYRTHLQKYARPPGRLERALTAIRRAELAVKSSYQNRRRILELLVYCLVEDAPSDVLDVSEYVA